MSTETLSRRSLLKAGALAGGGLLLSMHLPALRAGEADAQVATLANAFLRIDGAGKITLILPHGEVGQGIYTSASMLMAEELEVGLDQIGVEAAPPDLAKYLDPLLGDQATGGSTSIRSDWMRLRKAAASARIMLVGAAAQTWKVDASACRVERGVIKHAASNREIGFGEVASLAATQPVPKDADVKLKERGEFKLIGTRAKRIDTPSKVDGTAVFGIDVKVPGMKIGTLAISPVKGGRLVKMDEAAARRVPGVLDIVRDGDDAVAVIGDHMWAAKQGLEALKPVWFGGVNATVNHQKIVDAIDAASRKPGVVAKKEGEAARAVADSKTKLDAVYRLPFLAHAPMEPLNCTIHVQADRADVWVGTQVPVRARNAVAKVTGLPVEKVTVNTMIMGGAFGRRLEEDSVFVAAAIAKQVKHPVKLVWTREEDMRHDYYRPYYHNQIGAGLDGDGRLVGWTHRVTGPSILARWAPDFFKNGLDSDAVEGAAETPYAVPATFVDYVRHEPQGVNTGWWRGVGPTHNVFVVESFVDELAGAAKQDPVAFRRAMMTKNPRALAVMELAAKKAGWGTPMAAGSGRGIAVQFAFGTYLACVMEVDVSKDGDITLRRGVIAVDCGITVNPDTVRAQMEGGLIFGLGTAMFNRITFKDGVVEQGNFDDYRAIRINEAPKIEVYQIDSGEAPGGIGEAATSAAAPALANAIFAASGKRLRELPFAPQ
jgi:isoquinoline 1-oxidoreductase beta subunit